MKIKFRGAVATEVSGNQHKSHLKKEHYMDTVAMVGTIRDARFTKMVFTVKPQIESLRPDRMDRGTGKMYRLADRIFSWTTKTQ